MTEPLLSKVLRAVDDGLREPPNGAVAAFAPKRRAISYAMSMTEQVAAILVQMPFKEAVDMASGILDPQISDILGKGIDVDKMILAQRISEWSHKINDARVQREQEQSDGHERSTNGQ